MPKKQKGMRRRGRGCGFNHKLSRQLSPSSLTPQTSCAPHRGRLPLRQKTPAARPPRAPAALSASRAADPKLALPAFAQVIRKAPATPRRPQPRARLPRPRRSLPAYMAPSEPWSPARKGCPSAAAEPQFPKELIPVAGGGGAKGKSRRRRKGREGSAAIRAQESAQGRTEREKRRAT